MAENLPHKHGYAYVPLDGRARDGMKSLRDAIKPEHLSGSGLEEEPHITVRYGLKFGGDKVKQYLAQCEPFTVKLGRTKAFTPSASSDGAAPIYCDVTDAKPLHDLHKAIGDLGEWEPLAFDYSPHATVAYVQPSLAHLYQGLNHAEGTEVPVRHVAIRHADGTKEEVELRGRGKSASADFPDAADGIVRLDKLIRDAKGGHIRNTDPEVRWKSVRLALKDVGDDGTITGYASVYNNIDSDDEVMLPGCFDRSLDHNPHPVVLWQHDSTQPIGFHVTQDVPGLDPAHGLPIRAELILDCEAGRHAYAFAKKAKKVGGKAGLSVGFRVIKSKEIKGSELPAGSGADSGKTYRGFVECQLLEYSPVTFPANSEAFVTGVKAAFDAANRKLVSPVPGDNSRTQEEQEMLDFTEVVKDDTYLANLFRAKKGGHTASVDGVEHPASDFAYVPDPEKPSTWKLPIFDEAHVRNALARFNQTELPSGEKPKVFARIRAAARRMGIHVSEDDGPGKSMTAGYNHAAGAANYDFDNVLGEHRRARENEKDRRDIDNALVDTLSRIHGSDAHPDEKKAAIRKAYHKHAEHMADCHIKEMFPDESYGAGPATGEGKSLAIIGEVKASLGALTNLLAKAGRRVSAANAAALIDTAHMHHKALKHHVDVLKDVVGDTTRLPEMPNDGDESYGGGPATGESKSGRRMSQATKAALKDAYHEHRKALHNHHRVLKSMFEDNTPLDDGALDDPDLGNDEMGAMSSRQQVTGKSADELLKDVGGRLAALTAK